MFSRLAQNTAKLQKNVAVVAVRAVATTPAKNAEGGEVAIQRPQRLERPPATRFVFIPDEWFQNFYKKTGVTGPYVFGISFGTFLFSKEYMIVNGEFNVAILMALLIGYGIKNYGGALTQLLDKRMLAEEQKLNSFRDGSIKSIQDAIDGEKREQDAGEGHKALFETKRENVAMQLETEYRSRVMRVYGEVKKRMDYHLETDNVKRNVEQKHMVDWIIKNVRGSITPEQEKQSLQTCIARIKALGAAS